MGIAYHAGQVQLHASKDRTNGKFRACVDRGVAPRDNQIVGDSDLVNDALAVAATGSKYNPDEMASHAQQENQSNYSLHFELAHVLIVSQLDFDVTEAADNYISADCSSIAHESKIEGEIEEPGRTGFV